MADRRAKSRAAAVSIVSNSALIALKLITGLMTGSIALIGEAIHSSIDLLASLVTFFSVSKAGEPADESHHYGHAKMENLAAAILGLMILAGAGVVVYAAIGRLGSSNDLHSLGFGIAAIAVSIVTNIAVSRYLKGKSRKYRSPALEGDALHLSTDALTSAGVLIGLVTVQVTGVELLDPVAALAVACVILVSGSRVLIRSTRVLVDETLPAEELEAVRAVLDSSPDEVCGFHKLRARRAGSDRYLDLHIQFLSGTTLERAHELAHKLQLQIAEELEGGADVLIHLEPSSKRSEDVDGSGGANGQ